MAVPRIVAAHIGIETVNTMDEPLLHQEIQCAIDCRRRGGGMFPFELIQEPIRADLFVIFPDQFEHPATQWGQSNAARLANPGGGIYGTGRDRGPFARQREWSWKRTWDILLRVVSDIVILYHNNIIVIL